MPPPQLPDPKQSTVHRVTVNLTEPVTLADLVAAIAAVENTGVPATLATWELVQNGSQRLLVVSWTTP